MTTITADWKRFLVCYVLPYKKLYILGFLALIATNLISLAVPQLSKRIINAMADQNMTSDFTTTAWAVIGLGFAVIVIRTLSRVFIFLPARNIEKNTRDDTFQGLIGLAYEKFETLVMGDVLSLMSNEIGYVRAFFAFALLQILNLIFLVVFIVSMMVFVSPILTLAAIIPLLLSLCIMSLASAKNQEISKKSQEILSDLTQELTEIFRHISPILVHSLQDVFLRRFSQKNDEMYSITMRYLILRLFLFPIMGFLTNISQVLVLGVGGYLVMNERLSVGDILAFNVYVAFLSFPMSAMSFVFVLYHRAKRAVIKLQEIGDLPQEKSLQTTPAHSATKTVLAPQFVIDNLSFSYPFVGGNERQLILKHLSFKIEPGQRLAICGSVGSGKSTLLNILYLLIRPEQGRIFFEGKDILSQDLIEYRKKIGYALQSPYLFSNTIRENLQIAVDEPLDDERIWTTLERVDLGVDIRGFSSGLDTIIGEKGMRLSGGQKQRMALARLYLQDRPIMLLDDVLSAVDRKTEDHIIQNLFSADKTVIIATHRLSVLEHCDLILHLKEGNQIFFGPVAEGKKHPYFRELTEQAGEARS